MTGLELTKVRVCALLAEEMPLLTGYRIACSLQAQGTRIKSPHGLIAETFLQGSMGLAVIEAKAKSRRRVSGRTPFVPYSSFLRSAYENIEDAVLFLLCLVIMCGWWPWPLSRMTAASYAVGNGRA
jgi:hypothetical protein